MLLDRRRPGTHLEGLWEFPGGKREAAESDERALERELLEELGVESTILSPAMAAVEYSYDDFDLTLVLYAAELHGRPEPLQVAEIAWHPLETLDHLEMPPANQSLIQTLWPRPPGTP